MALDDQPVMNNGFKIVNHSPADCGHHLFDVYPDVAKACDRFREFFGEEGYRIDEAEKAVRDGSVPDKIVEPLYAVIRKDRFLLESFLPRAIVMALRGEEFVKKKHYQGYHRKKG